MLSIVTKKSKKTLDEMLKKITPKNRHPETGWGEPVGRERFWEDVDETPNDKLKKK